jgi:hypothetical protein
LTEDVRRFFAEIDAAPVVWHGPPPVDQAVFDRNYARKTPERGLDDTMLWALATAKTNRAERYGVEREVEAHGVPPNATDDPHVSDPIVLCGEIVGVALFSLLLEKARVLFASQPEALGRIEALFAQIMVDEVGHVHFVRSRLSASQLAWAQRILPLVAHGALDDLPELVKLFGRKTIVERVVAADVDGAAAPYPDRLVFSAA